VRYKNKYIVQDKNNKLKELKYDINLEGKVVNHIKFYLSGYSQIEYENKTYYLPTELLKNIKNENI